jgi:hypothetical protein
MAASFLSRYMGETIGIIHRQGDNWKGRRKAIQEVQTMAKDGLPFDRLIEEMGLAAKWRAEGKIEGKVEGEAIGKINALKETIAFLKQGHTVEDLEQMIPIAPNSN